jgi:hypothetical protein
MTERHQGNSESDPSSKDGWGKLAFKHVAGVGIGAAVGAGIGAALRITAKKGGAAAGGAIGGLASLGFGNAVYDQTVGRLSHAHKVSSERHSQTERHR